MRLFFSAVVWSVGILLIAGVVLSAVYQRTAEADFDRRLGIYLRALVADVAASADDAQAPPVQLGEPLFEISLSGWYWQITRMDGQDHTIRSSVSLFTNHLPRLANQGVVQTTGGARQGYIDGPDGRKLRMVERVIDVGDQGVYLVQVAATIGDMQDQIHNFQIALALTFSILALALVASSAWQVRFGLDPLRRLQQGVGAIRRGENDRIEGTFPQDIMPLAGELNLLLDSNRAIVERARTQVGNLAHALKTPLSVITNERDDDPIAYTAKVREQANIMRDQVTYYLDRARVAARAGAFGLSIEVVPVVEGLIRTFGKLFPNIELSLEVADDAHPKFAGERQDLEEMLGNLIDNACKWSRSAVTVRLSDSIGQDERRRLIALIDDDGPGLPEPSRLAAQARGKRLDETKPGSGLGLSIVVELAELYNGGLTLETSPEQGLRAKLVLPATQ